MLFTYNLIVCLIQKIYYLSEYKNLPLKHNFTNYIGALFMYLILFYICLHKTFKQLSSKFLLFNTCFMGLHIHLTYLQYCFLLSNAINQHKTSMQINNTVYEILNCIIIFRYNSF